MSRAGERLLDKLHHQMAPCDLQATSSQSESVVSWPDLHDPRSRPRRQCVVLGSSNVVPVLDDVENFFYKEVKTFNKFAVLL
jgi:hypothetical protein